MKKILCFIFGHRWTSPELEKEIKESKPGQLPTIVEMSGQSLRDHFTLTCKRCGSPSKHNKMLDTLFPPNEVEEKRKQTWAKICETQN